MKSASPHQRRKNNLQKSVLRLFRQKEEVILAARSSCSGRCRLSLVAIAGDLRLSHRSMTGWGVGGRSVHQAAADIALVIPCSSR